MKLDRTLLLVDNVEDGLESLQTSLARKYGTVLMATNLREALALYGRQPVDIVIVALEMFQNEGYQTIDAIYAANPDQRILTYSAVPENPSSHVSCEECTKSNRRHRIRKPVQLEELYHEIENFDALTCREARLG